MKRWVKIVAVLAIMLVLAFVWVCDGLSEMMALQLDGLDLGKVADGSYTGTFPFKRWNNTMKVVVEGGRIKSIVVVDDVGAAFITDCSGETIRRVVEAQDTRIDTISGATVTTKAYLKAIENALIVSP